MTKPFKEFEKEMWSKLAAAYSNVWPKITDHFLPHIVKNTILDSKKVVDLACGSGELTNALQRNGALSTGYDFCPEMINAAKRKYPECSFYVGDVEQLPIANKSVDLALCNFGFEHFPNARRAASEIARILKPGGAFKYTVWAEPERNGYHKTMALVLDQMLSSSNCLETAEGKQSYYSLSFHKRLLTDAGFEKDSVKRELVTAIEPDFSANDFFEAELKASVKSGERLRSLNEADLLLAKNAFLDLNDAEIQGLHPGHVEHSAYVIMAVKN